MAAKNIAVRKWIALIVIGLGATGAFLYIGAHDAGAVSYQRAPTDPQIDPSPATPPPVQAANNQPAPPSAPAGPTEFRDHIAAVSDGETLGIGNISDEDWTGCGIGINPSGMFNEGYTLDGGVTIAAHKFAVFPLRNFSNSDGERFDPDTRVAKMVLVNCGAQRVGVVGVRKMSVPS